MESIDVIIIGGGLNGLTMAVLLAHHGVRCILIERHTGTSIQYKFAGISPRSMEIFRDVGLEEEIRARQTGDQQVGQLGRGRNLADPALTWSGAAWPDASPFSPTQPATCDQHVLEPILKRRAEALGADVRFGAEFLALEQDANGVRVRVRGTQGEQSITGKYLIAADGASGNTRELLGIGRSGAGVLQHWMNIIFDTELAPTIDGKRFTSCFVTDINATITPRPGGRWLLSLQYSPEKGERPEDFDAAKCRDLVARGAGRPEVRADLVDARPWEAAAYVADRFQSGRCFVLGDAAHLVPPTGAFGGNSGIHDAHNLAWKLAYVLRGEASPELLDTFDAERRPLIQATLDQAMARLQKWFRNLGGNLPAPAEMVADYDVVLGQRYREGAFLAAPTADQGAFVAHASLSGVPGTRLPHRSIEIAGKPASTLDLIGRKATLVTAGDAHWEAAARELAGRGFALDVVACDAIVNAGVEADGALLVRPDHFVAWKSARFPPNASDALANAVRTLRMN